MSNEQIALAVANGDYEFLKKVPASHLSDTVFSVPSSFSLNSYESYEKNNDYIGVSLIHIASLTDSLECYMYIEKKTKLNYKTLSSSSKNCLFYCCAGGSIEVLSYIFSQCQEPAAKNELKELFEKDYTQETTLLSHAVLAKSNEVIQLLLDNDYGIGKGEIDLRNTLVTKPISIALKRKYVNCLKTLLIYKQSLRRELSPLQVAISANMLDAVQLLLDSDTTDSLNYINPQGETALSIACIVGSVPIVKLLCSRMQNIDIPISESYTSAIHWLCKSGNPEIMKIMLEHLPDLTRIDQSGKPGIAYLSTANKDDDTIIQMLDLLEQAGYNMNDPKFPAITVVLSAFHVKAKLVEWFLKRNVNLDLPYKRNQSVAVKTIRQAILEKRRLQDFKELIEKYHLDTGK